MVADITNLLPNDTQAVLSIPMNKVTASSLKGAALDAEGGFKEEAFRKTFGFGLDGITRVVMGRAAARRGR